MTATEPIQAGPYPEPSDAPDGPNQMAGIVTWAAGRTNTRFANVTARDAAITGPVEGMEAFTGSGSTAQKWLYLNAAWRDITPGSWTAYTPTLTGVTLGNGAITGRYLATPQMLTVRARLAVGSSTVISGGIAVGLPLAVSTALNFPWGTTEVVDASAPSRRYLGACLLVSSTSMIGLIDTGTGAAQVSGAAPITVASGDALSLEASFEV